METSARHSPRRTSSRRRRAADDQPRFESDLRLRSADGQGTVAARGSQHAFGEHAADRRAWPGFLRDRLVGALLVAIRPEAKGDVTPAVVLASHPRRAQQAVGRSSPAISSSWSTTSAFVSCLEAKTGSPVWTSRLAGTYSASPLAAAGRVYFFNEDGQATVIEAARAFKVAAENHLENGFMASPAVAANSLSCGRRCTSTGLTKAARRGDNLQSFTRASERAMQHHKNLAILVGGGPAPGINSVIGAATIRARLEGLEVIGVRDGFEWLMQGDIEHVVPLTIENVSRIHFRGGSYLGIARANPTSSAERLDATLDSLLRLNVSQLITIGGDDTAFSAMKARGARRGRHPRRSRPEDHRQRSLPAGACRHLRFPVGAPLRSGDRQEPDGRRQDDVAVVFRGRDGAQGGAPRAWDRQRRPARR